MPVTVRCDACGNAILGSCVRVRVTYQRTYATKNGLDTYGSSNIWEHPDVNLVLHKECAERHGTAAFDVGAGMGEE